MKTLVTGATGLIGSTLTRQLLAADTSVRILHRPTSSFDLLGAAADRIERVTGDLLDARSLYSAMEGVTHVYHAAALVESEAASGALHRANVHGTANVVNAALQANIRRLVHVSSIAALGHPEDDPAPTIDEASAWRPPPSASAYARSKYDAELEVHRSIAEGLDAVIVNPSLVFGTGRPGANTRRIIDTVRSGWLPGVPAGSTNVVDVKDVAAGLRRAMAHGTTGERYILGSENLTWKSLIHTLADAFGTDPPTRIIPPHLLTVAGGLAEAAAWLTGTTPHLTRSLARSASRQRRYDNAKATTQLGCTFRPFVETAQRIARELGTSADQPLPSHP